MVVPAATLVPRHTPALVQRYINYLKDRFINKSPILKEKLVKVRPKKFIHLNLVSNAAQEEEEEEVKSQCLLLQLHGDVAAIKKKRRPMEMEDIGISEDQSVAQHILVEGSPGIGKTMFSWELCRQWAEGKMLQDKDIVLMLQLRSKSVREAKSLSDLFHHSNDSIKQEVLDHVTSVDGRGVFLVLEGYDELTDDQRTEDSLLNKLLIGDCLPKASIMVTSRPLASVSLCPEFRESVDQHIEVLGFSDEDIKSYVETACHKQPQVLADLLSYISSNPFVSSVMYIPLQCAILTALYIEKWKQNKGGLYAPTTLTQLYTDLLLSSLIRYISDHLVYSKCKAASIRQLTDLPSEVQEQVWKLSQLAAEGLENRQFIFDSIPCDDMGLMQSAEEELVIGSSVSYCFLHLTLQEYLAALHWSRMGSGDMVRLVSETSLFPLDTLVREGITEAAGYHWPALYFLSGLTKLTSVPLELLKISLEAADNHLKDEYTMKTICKYPFLFPVYSAGVGARYNPYYFQLLFESQSCDLVNELFVQETIQPWITNPLECFVTAWCVANSSPSSRWSLIFDDMSILAKFVDHFERFGCCSIMQQHGAIVGLRFARVSIVSAILSSLSMLFPFLEYFGLYGICIPVVDVIQFVPLFCSLHNLVSLKSLGITIEGDEGVLPAVTIPPQHCPSLSWVKLNGTANSVLFQSLVLPNIKALSVLICPMASSDLSSLCTGLCQTTSLKIFRVVDTDLTTHEAKELASALEQNRSLEVVTIDKDSVTITDDGIRILRQVLSNHPTLKEIGLPDTETDHSSSPTPSDDDDDDDYDDDDVDDLRLAMAMSLSLAREERMKEEEEELQRVMSLSLLDQ